MKKNKSRVALGLNSVFTFVASYIFNDFECEKHNKNLTNFHILLNKKNQNVERNIPLYVFRILFNNDAQQISFNSAKTWPRKWYRIMTFS